MEEIPSCLLHLLFYFHVVSQILEKTRRSRTQRSRGKARVSLRKYTWFVCAVQVPINGLCFYSFLTGFISESLPVSVQSGSKRNAVPLYCAAILIHILIYLMFEGPYYEFAPAGVGPPIHSCRGWIWFWWKTFLRFRSASRSARF